VYGTSGTKSDLCAFRPKTGELKQLGPGAVAKQEHIASIEADPTGRYLYYVPGAHGGAAADGSPVVQYDVKTGKKKVIAFLHDVFWEKYGTPSTGRLGRPSTRRGSDRWASGFSPLGYRVTRVTPIWDSSR
jgi:hypothetical protein